MKKKKVLLSLLGMMILMLSIIVWLVKTGEHKTVNALPLSTIEIGSGVNKFTVPKDAIGLVEGSLITNPAYSGYVQDKKFNGKGLSKGGSSAYSTMVYDMPMGNVFELPNGDKLLSTYDISYGRNSIHVGSVYTVTLLLLGSNYQTKDAITISNGAADNPDNQLFTTLGGTNTFARDSSYISSKGGGIYSIRYFGYSMSGGVLDTSGLEKELEFSIVGNKIISNKWNNLNNPYTAGHSIIEERILTNTNRTFRGLISNIALIHTATNKQSLPITYYNGISFVKEIDLKFSYSELGVLNGIDDYSLRTEVIGKLPASSNVPNGYFAKVNVQGPNYNHIPNIIMIFDVMGDLVKIHNIGDSGVPIVNKEQGNLSTLLTYNKNDNLYYLEDEYSGQVITKTFLKKYNIGTGGVTTELTLPPKSTVMIEELDTNELMLLGYNGNGTSDLSPFVGNSKMYIAYSDSDLNITRASEISMTDTLEFKEISYNKTTNKLTWYGHGETRDFTNLPRAGWKTWITPLGDLQALSKVNTLWGEIVINNDYSPVLKFGNSTINVDVSAGTNVIASTLLADVSVKDSYDQSAANISGTKSQKWLDNRINRNPETIEYDSDGESLKNVVGNDIDWKTLGFDSTKTGPEQLTYFVTDSQKQATANSRWVNKTKVQTTDKDNYFLDKVNFSISLTDIGTVFTGNNITDTKYIKENAKTKAWNGNDGTVEEDGSLMPSQLNNTKVIFSNLTQLNTLRNATEAKPYPIDIEYKPNGTTTVKNRIWIFVTTKNTVVNDSDGIIVYANDYEEKLRVADQETVMTMWTKSDIKVYDYHSSNMIGASLPVLADKNNITGLGAVASDVTVINTATVPKLYANIQLTYNNSGKITTVLIDITLTRNPLLVHMQQVVVNANSELVTPTIGNMAVQNVNHLLPSNVTSTVNKINLHSPSQLGDFTNYKLYKLPLSDEHWYYNIVPTIPEYYQLIGSIVTNTNISHIETSKDGAHVPIIIDGKKHEEYWVTVYLEPTTHGDKPRFYGWSYGNSQPYTVTP